MRDHLTPLANGQFLVEGVAVLTLLSNISILVRNENCSMSILISGDFHSGQKELTWIAGGHLKKVFSKEDYESIKYHIVLGDMGILWPTGKKTDIYNLKCLGLRPFPLFFLPGNHEPILARELSEFEQVDFGFGNPVYRVYQGFDCFYMPRGKSYTIDDKKLLVLGGALSIDKVWRTEGESWWPQEYWNLAEKNAVMELLETEHTFDYVLAHTGPNLINKIVFAHQMDASHGGKKFMDTVALLNDAIDEKIKYKTWFSGHWHSDESLVKDGKEYRYLYQTPHLI
jgi:hypothetical protein